MTLVINTGKVNRCRYVEVRKTNFQRFQYGGKKLLIMSTRSCWRKAKKHPC